MKYVKLYEGFYDEIYHRSMLVNRSQVQSDLKSKYIQTKIDSYIKKFYNSNNDPQLRNRIEYEIENNEYFANFFAKDPIRQNIYEKSAYDHIINMNGVNKELSINYPNSKQLFTENGKLVNNRPAGSKSIDFRIVLNNGTIIFISHKFINDNGGAQDNQFNDVYSFVRNSIGASEKYSETGHPNVYFIALCDGKYFYTFSKKSHNQMRIKYLKNVTKQDPNVWICSIDNEQGEISEKVTSIQDFINYNLNLDFDNFGTESFKEIIEFSN